MPRRKPGAPSYTLTRLSISLSQAFTVCQYDTFDEMSDAIAQVAAGPHFVFSLTQESNHICVLLVQPDSMF